MKDKKDRKTKNTNNKDKKTRRQKDKRTKRSKDKKTKRQKDRKKERQEDRNNNATFISNDLIHQKIRRDPKSLFKNLKTKLQRNHSIMKITLYLEILGYSLIHSCFAQLKSQFNLPQRLSTGGTSGINSPFLLELLFTKLFHFGWVG